MKNLRLLALISQFAVSIITPLFLCIFGARWLMLRYATGRWIMAVGVLLGIMGAVSGLINSLKQLQREADKETKKRPISFNDHE